MALQYDPAQAVATLCKVDRKLAHVVRRAGPFTLQPDPLTSPFTALAKAIVYQQLSGKAAATIFGRVQALAPARGQGLDAPRILKLPIERLRAAGCSMAKCLGLKDLAAKWLDGTVPTLARLKKMPDEEIVARLTQVRGIGPWSVEMLLIFRLGRPDVLPTTDLGVRKGFMLTYGHADMPTPKSLLQQCAHWRPYRSVASWYMWRATELDWGRGKPRES